MPDRVRFAPVMIPSESPPELVSSTELLLWQFLLVEISVSPVGSVGGLASRNWVDVLIAFDPQ
jgi:hypothetical protein